MKLFSTHLRGGHTIYVFANNSFGITVKNVTFSVDLGLFRILYEEYKGVNRGSSTDFITFAFEDLQNLSDIILENTQYGKIAFNEAINLTDDSDPGDNLLDLDSNTNVSFNRIELDPIALPNFDKMSTLILYGLTFTNPRILKDGEVCLSIICARNSYAGGDLSFNVTHFSPLRPIIVLPTISKI